MLRKIVIHSLLLILTACIFTTKAYAVAPGFYLGLMLGPSTNGAGPQNVQVFPLPTPTFPIANRSIANPRSQQFGSRFFLGYKMNCFAGFELGFVFFSGINYVLRNSSLRPAGGTTFRVRGIDLVGKIDYTVLNTIGAFAKLGAVALYTTTPGGLNITNYQVITTLNRAKNRVETRIVNSGSNTYQTKIAPTFSIGITYDLTQSWQADVSWTRYMVGGIISNIDFYAVGLSYHFVDRYCGQFLCDD